MASKLYQVTLNEDGEAVSVLRLPDEPEKKRTIFIREHSHKKAKELAETLFSFAK